MIIEDVFTSFLAVEVLNIDNVSLEKYCRNTIDSDLQTGDLDLNAPELQPLISNIENKMNELHVRLGLSNLYEQKLIRIWANLNNPYEISRPHSHGDSFFSAVYYVSGGQDCGDIQFITPVKQMIPIVRPSMIGQYNKYFSETFSASPYVGHMLMFPAWLWHYVVHNFSGKDRISIAFDTQIVKK